MCPQPLETELPGRVNCPFVAVLVIMITGFLQKFATTCLVQLKINRYIASRPEDICTSLDHSERKVPEFLHNSHRTELLHKGDKCTFTTVVASASVSLVCSS